MSSIRQNSVTVHSTFHMHNWYGIRKKATLEFLPNQNTISHLLNVHELSAGGLATGMQKVSNSWVTGGVSWVTF